MVFFFIVTNYENNLDDLLSLSEEYDAYPVVTRLPGDLVTPLSAYCAISENGAQSFLFESVEGGEHLARYSFLGADPVFSIREPAGGTAGDTKEDRILNSLRRALPKLSFPPIDGLPGFLGGAVGYLDFDVSKDIEPALAQVTEPQEGFVGSRFMFFRRIIAFDHVRQSVNIVNLVFGEDAGDDRGRLEELLTEAAASNEETAERLQSRPPASGAVTQEPAAPSEFRSNFEKADFESAVMRIKDLIAAGECYQVVLSQCFSRETTASPLEIYRALRSLNPSPYMFLMDFGDRAVIGASPEMLVRARSGKLEYRPIAGTRPRGNDGNEDDRLAKEMLADEKELAEHRMLVDLGRNDLGRVAEYGSVKVDELMSVEKFSHVQHIVSSVSARLRPDRDALHALESCFPAGTVTGAPKVRAMQIIEELEPTARGVYAGAVGYIDHQGNLETCIAIRTIHFEDGVARIQAGAGIVADSVPEKEFEETVHKAAALKRAVEMAESGRFSLRPDRNFKEESA